MVKMTGGAAANIAATTAQAGAQAGGGSDLQGVIFSALDLVKPSGQGTASGGLFDADTLNKIIVLIDKLTTLTGNIYRLSDKMKQKTTQEDTINATFTEKQPIEAIEAAAQTAEQNTTQPTNTAGIQAAAEAIRKLSEENTILRYKLSQTQITAEKIDQYLEFASFIIPDDTPFSEVKKKIKDNLPLIMKFAGGNNDK